MSDLTSMPITDPLLGDIVHRLAEAYHPREIRLFGSRASGNAANSSDYDLCVVVEESDMSPARRCRAGIHALWGVPAAVDLMVYTHEEYQRGLAWPVSSVSMIEKNGKRVYATV